MKRLAAAFITLLLACAAHAQNPETPYKKVALTSLIGDVITLDIYRKRVGTLIDTNLQEHLAVPSPVFDEVALKAASDALAKALPSATLATLTVGRRRVRPGSRAVPD